MTVTTYESPALVERLLALEAELAELKRFFKGRALQAQSFILAHGDGRAQGWFALSENGNPEFKLAARDGSVRAEIALDESGAPRIVLFDDEGKQRAALQVAESGEPSTYLWDSGGANMIALRALTDGNCELILNGGVKGRLRLATDPEGASRVELLDEDQDARIALRSGADRPAELLLLDSLGDPRAELFLDSNDATGLKLHDYLGNHRLSVALDYIGKPEVVLFDAEETEAASLRPSQIEEKGGSQYDDEELEDDDEAFDDDADDEDDVEDSFDDEASHTGTNLELGSMFSSRDSSCVQDLRSSLVLFSWAAITDCPDSEIESLWSQQVEDDALALVLHGFARSQSWNTTSMFGQESSHDGCFLFLSVLNRTEDDVALFLDAHSFLLDDRGHQYAVNGGFWWVDDSGRYHVHPSTLVAGARQEGMLPFPELRSGSRKFVKYVFKKDLCIGGEYIEKKYAISLE